MSDTSTIDPTTVDPARLQQLLTAHHAAYPSDQAALQLLIRHDMWLRRSDFLRACVWVVTGEDTDEQEDGPFAGIDWKMAAQALDTGKLRGAATSAEKVLRIAISLASDQTVQLRNCVTGLGAVTAELVAQAVLEAAGHDRAAVTVARPELPDFLRQGQ